MEATRQGFNVLWFQRQRSSTHVKYIKQLLCDNVLVVAGQSGGVLRKAGSQIVPLF